MTLKSAVIYVDCENIFQTLDRYGADPFEMNFFPVIFDRLKTVHQFNPIKCNIYFNFNKFNYKYQNDLQRLGLTICPSMNKGKNSSDLLLTVDAMTTLYENPALEAFIFISSDRDMAPILTSVRCKGKITYLMTEKRGASQTLIHEADIHEYLEDILDLKPEMLVDPQSRILLADLGVEKITVEAIAQAKKISVMLYSSIMWNKCEERNDPLTLDGYLPRLSKRVNLDIEALRKNFEIAHCLGYVTIYKDEVKRCLCFKKGEKYEEVMDKAKQQKSLIAYRQFQDTFGCEKNNVTMARTKE